MKNKHILILLMATALLLGSTACHKDAQIEPKTPKVTEPDVSFTATTANFGWTVSFPGKVSSVVKVSRHADMDDATSYGDATPTSNKDFHVEITGLSPETQYYYCFEIWNPNLNHGSEVKSFTTQALQKPTVTTASVSQFNFINATAVGGGEVSGDAVTERGIYFGTSPNPATTGTKLVASSAGTGSFTCTMTGLVPGTYYVCAYATNGQGTSYGSEKSFSYNPPPIGCINGIFSLSSSKKVYFSQGNLQYQASTNTWRFADNQYDYIGSENSNISSAYSGWIDLFGWGTSGYNHGANCYQPWSTSSSGYYAYGNYYYNLYDQTGQADWGYNPISNGGNQTNQWRTLTQPEWAYVFNTRTTTSGIRYAKANVNNVNGVILLPDDWSSSTYSLSNTNSGSASFSSNTLTTSQWSTLEQAGAVFLPAAGNRYGTSVDLVGSNGFYWSASCSDSYCAYYVFFIDASLGTNDDGRYHGLSVRLVAPAEN